MTVMLFQLGSFVQCLSVVVDMSSISFFIEPSPSIVRLFSRMVGNFSLVAENCLLRQFVTLQRKCQVFSNVTIMLCFVLEHNIDTEVCKLIRLA